MALGPLAGLSARARAAYPIIRGAVSRGATSAEITEALQRQGLGIRRQKLLDIIRHERGAAAASSRLRNIGRDRRPDPTRLPEALTTLRRAFSFTVEVRGVDPDTGATIVRPVTVSTSRIMTRREIEAEAMKFIDADGSRYGMDAVYATLVEGRRAGSAGTLS